MARIETGEVARPSPEIMQRIAEALELDSGVLLTFIGVKPTTALPTPRIYFRRAYGMTAEEAETTAERVEQIIAELRTHRKHQPARKIAKKRNILRRREEESNHENANQSRHEPAH